MARSWSRNHQPDGWIEYPRGTDAARKGRHLNIYTGQDISRREYLNLVAKSYGWNNYGEYTRFSRAAGGLGGMDTEGAKLAIGTMLNAKMDVIARSEFIKNNRNKYLLVRLAHNPNDMSWNGPLGQWMVAIGLRQPGWRFDVGDSDRNKRRRA